MPPDSQRVGTQHVSKIGQVSPPLRAKRRERKRYLGVCSIHDSVPNQSCARQVLEGTLDSNIGGNPSMENNETGRVLLLSSWRNVPDMSDLMRPGAHRNA